MSLPTIALAGLLLIAPTLAMAGSATPSGKVPPGQNGNGSWGELTSDDIAANGGRQVGEHASNPCGDDPDCVDQPRKGLPNLDGRGDLSATIDIVTSVP
jgi:hypothetical protein